MKLPKTITAGIYTFGVVKRSVADMDDLARDGHIEVGKLLISIRRKAPDRVLQDTLMHESLHAVMWAHGIRFALDIDAEDEEKLVSLLAPAMVALLHDNPALVAALTPTEEAPRVLRVAATS